MSAGQRRATPPVVARAVLWMALDRGAFEVVCGDLEEEFAAAVSAGLRLSAARRSFWRDVLSSIGAAWRGEATAWRRGDGLPPEPERGGPLRRILSAGLQDLRYAGRQLRRSPGFTLAAAGTLGLGIAATTTVFTLVNALVLRPLPYRDSARVAFLLAWDTRQNEMLFNMSAADAADLATLTDAFSGVAVYRGWNANLSGGSALPERVQAYRVSANTFGLLDVPAALGRTFAADAGGRVDAHQVVLSHGLWMRRFGADPSIVGRTIDLNGEAHTVVGVMPAVFEFPVFNFKGDLWTPLDESSLAALPRGESPSVVAVARLGDGTDVGSAQAAADGLMTRLAATYPETNAGRSVHVVPMGSMGADQSRPAFAIMSAAVLVVLLVACVNVANLLLARGLSRGREFALRAALGAGRGRLFRQVLVEGLLLSVLGGTVGLGLGWWSIERLRRSLPDFVLRVLPGVDAIRLDSTAMAFTAAVSLLTVLVFGLLPAWQAGRLRLVEALKTDGRATGPGRSRRRWLRGGLVAAEIAVSVSLLITTGLLGRSAHKLLTARPGFDAGRLLTLNVALPRERYPAYAERQRFFEQYAARLRSLPGVDAVGMVNALPFSTSDEATDFTIEGRTPAEVPPPTAGLRVIGGEYFRALGVPVLFGRDFSSTDERTDANAVIVNLAFVQKYFDGTAGDALGHRVRIERLTTTVVGVVGNVQHSALWTPARPEIYLPYSVSPRAMMSLAVRTRRDPSTLAVEVRRAAAEVDPAQAIYDVAPMTRLVANSFLPQSLASSMMTIFGAVAAFLAALGLYGLLAFAVRQRTAEIGVRVALGASHASVLGLVFRQALGLVAGGLVVGGALTALTARGLTSLLFGVGAFDPLTYAGTAALLVLIALAAAYLPARRALQIDPVLAIRGE
jgi:putative ABC transport system permease protein